jgi:hypothetical protein
MSHLPTDPTAPREPVLVPRGRPATVTLAGVLMLGGAAAGFLIGVTTLVASGRIGRDFEVRAAEQTGAPAEEIANLAASVQALFFGVGGAGAGLALAMVALAIGVLRANTSARFTTVVLAVISMFCGASTMGLGAGRSFTVTLDGGQVDLGESLRAAVPTGLTSLTAGLGCVLTLGYIAVVVLLLLPSSGAYFRRRPGAVPAPEPEDGGPEDGGPERGGPERGGPENAR